MGSGKSSVGQLLSTYLNTTFYDLDRGIEKRFNLSIKDIFQIYGESKFREVESELLIQTKKIENNIIATGGGILIDAGNREFLKNERVCFLDGPVEELYKRATKKRDQRPLLKEISQSEFAKIYHDRKNHYNECASLSVITDGKTIEEIAKEIISDERFNF
tara:strand:- start:606 stop:1088 length:483 start_codon:yes stop_codon:yes gene_type:complete